MSDASLIWPVLERTAGHDYGIFHTRWLRAANPETGVAREFVAIDCADWVNVIALTPDDRVVLVRQFRHGAEVVCIEIPGGMVDPGEAPRAAAERELREETGYVARAWLPLGVVRPNPAIQSNRLHTFLALDAEPLAATALEDGEVLALETRGLDEIGAMLRDGRIDHALVAVAFGHLALAAGGRLARPPG
jgi:8-oxo-dGTP pyrophosphatase MutT (NUDIX family)